MKRYKRYLSKKDLIIQKLDRNLFYHRNQRPGLVDRLVAHFASKTLIGLNLIGVNTALHVSFDRE